MKTIYNKYNEVILKIYSSCKDNNLQYICVPITDPNLMLGTYAWWILVGDHKKFHTGSSLMDIKKMVVSGLFKDLGTITKEPTSKEDVSLSLIYEGDPIWW